MTPYYQDASVTLYHGDCREVLPGLAQVDAVVTDPPYGIGSWSSTGGNSLRPEEAAEANKWDQSVSADLIAMAISKAPIAIVWGGNYYLGVLGPTRSPLIWDKGIRGMHFADGEMAWTNFRFGTLRILNLPLSSTEVKGRRQHPTQKPEGVMAWSIAQAKHPRVILDPFCGSGTTLVAAKWLGLRAIGIEKNEQYCEIAATRLSQGALTAMFDEAS